MSGRTVPRFALIGLLAATLTAPAVAQEGFQYPRKPAPVPEAPMPRAKANVVFSSHHENLRWDREPETAPMPQPNRPNLRAFSVYDRPNVGVPTMPVPVPPEVPVPTMGPPALPELTEFSLLRVKVRETATEIVPTTCPLPRIIANPLLGTWYREMPGVVIAATFTHDELKLCMTQSADGHTAVLTATAHYTITKDGLVYGAITGGDADLKRDPKTGESPFDDKLAELMMGMQEIVDVPFSFRTKMTSAGLMVSGMKSGTQMRRDETSLLGGMYKLAKDGRMPAPVALNTSKTDSPVVGAETGNVIGAATGTLIGNAAGKLKPATPDCQRVGIDFNTNPPVMSPPALPGESQTPYQNKLYKNVGLGAPQSAPAESFGPPYLSREPLPPPYQTPQPVKPVAVGVSDDATKQLATEAFGQLLQQSGVTTPGRATPFGGMTLPSGRYPEHHPQRFAPDPAFPLPRELASGVQPASSVGVSVEPVKGVAESRWYRDVAGKQCAVKISPDHLTLTVSEAQEENGKVSVASLVITADYHMTRDGITAVGLITSVDVNFEGEFPQEDTKPFFEMLNELQKALEDKPFALTIRAYDDALVIGNVRMPTVSDKMEVQPAVYMAGRYKSAGDKLPKPKAIKVIAEPKALPPAPGISVSPSAGTQGLPYYVAPPPAPNGNLLPPQTIPSPRVVPSSGSWAPSMTEPTPPTVPQMPQPVAPAVSSGSDVQQQLKKEWRWFWYNDQPGHLTPERIHGGIY